MSEVLRSSKEATFRAILAELGPMLKAETSSSAALLQEGHRLLAKDLEAMGATISRLEAAILAGVTDGSNLIKETQKLRSEIAIADQKVLRRGVPVRFPLFPVLIAAAVSGIISAGMATAAVNYFQDNKVKLMIEARDGRAIQAAFALMDPATRSKVQLAVNKASGGEAPRPAPVQR